MEPNDNRNQLQSLQLALATSTDTFLTAVATACGNFHIEQREAFTAFRRTVFGTVCAASGRRSEEVARSLVPTAGPDKEWWTDRPYNAVSYVSVEDEAGSIDSLTEGENMVGVEGWTEYDKALGQWVDYNGRCSK